MKAATAMAEKALIMTVPCPTAFLACRLIGALVTKSGFAMPSREGENGFVRSLICFVGGGPTKHCGWFHP
jgi:hypothetical protein